MTNIENLAYLAFACIPWFCLAIVLISLLFAAIRKVKGLEVKKYLALIKISLCMIAAWFFFIFVILFIINWGVTHSCL